MKFNTPYNYRFDEVKPGYYETNTLPSETVPDETMTVREIFQRYANGQPLSGNGRNPMSPELAASLPLNWDTMDLHEKHEFAASHKLKLTEAAELIKKNKEAEDEKAYKELIIAEYEAQLKEKNDPAPKGASDRISDQK